MAKQTATALLHVHVDCLYVTIRQERESKNYAVYTILGYDINGYKDILGLWLSESESKHNWMQIFDEIKGRGVEDVLFICMDGVSGLEEGARSIFKDAIVQRCIVHLIRNSLKYVPSKDYKKYTSDLKKVYGAINLEAAKSAFDAFRNEWDKYDELFMNDEERQINALPHIFEIPIELIDDFPDHPFQVRMDEDMQQLVDSVKERGLITPIILRKKDDDRYEIVSGHRRKKACELEGLTMVKAEVRDMTRDEAIITMVDSNLQRSQILPSEKAFAYKMRLEAMTRQGQRSDLTSAPVGRSWVRDQI